MKSEIKFFVLFLFCLCFLQISVSAQSNSLDEQIRLKEQALNTQQNELNILKEKRKKELEAEIAVKKAELDRLNGTPSDDTVVKPASTPVPSPQKDVKLQANPQSLPTDNTSRSSTNPQVQNKCIAINPLTQLEINICRIAEVAIKENAGEINSDSSLAEVGFLYATALQPEIVKGIDDAKRQLLFDSEKKRTDKQVGASSSNSGTTSLVVKGGAPAIIGWAIENGSMTSSIDGNTVTLRLNPYNFANAFFMKQGLFEIKDETDRERKDSFEEFLKKVNFGFSFDTSRGSETPTFIVSKQKLASWSVRYEFINRRNPLSDSPEMTERRNAYFIAQAPRTDAVTQAILDLDENPVLKPISDKWIKDVNDDLQQNLSPGCKQKPDPVIMAAVYEACRNKIFEVISQHLSSFPVAEVAKNEEVITKLRNLVQSQADFREERQKFLNEVNKGMVATFEYTNNREVNAPDTSNFRFIVERGIFARKKFMMDFTLNAELTMFNKKPAGTDVKRIKDFNLAFQTDIPLNDIMLFNDSVLSFALRYTRQASDVVLPNGVVADGTKGDILFGQGKLTIPIGDTGIRLPLSFTFANRSEFIKERFTKANFGLTFDLDQLFRFGPFTR